MNNRINFNVYETFPHACNYLPNRLATTVFVDPYLRINLSLYDKLSRQGFRRSGEHVYRPQCQKCNACIAVRVAVKQFVPRRSQRRTWQRNQDLVVSAAAPKFKRQHFELYCRYLLARHEGDGMDNPTKNSYMHFLTSSWSKTVFFEFHLKKQLVAVAVVDHLEKGLSAMYTFFDPDYSARSLGVYAILWEIEEAKRLNLDWLYLGYWIKDCRKMSYKTEYQPLEYFYQGAWLRAK
jgi:arginyl-tRNA--protein-N-Asp/Glu arginylyltransferase